MIVRTVDWAGRCLGETTIKTVIIGLLVVLASLGWTVAAEAQERATVQVRVWNSIASPDRHYISARYVGGSWNTLGTIALPFPNETDNGRFRYGDISLEVQPEGGNSFLVDIRVWKSNRLGDVHIGIRPEGYSWRDLGTVVLPLTELSRSGRYRYGDISRSVIPPPALPRVSGVEFFGEFTDDQRVRYTAAIEGRLESAARFLSTRSGVTVPEVAFELAVHGEPEAQGFAYGGGTIYLEQYRAASETTEQAGGSVTSGPSEFGFLYHLPHEYVHAIQDALARENGLGRAPHWFTEGMAWYFEAVYTRSLGPTSLFDREHIWWDARGSDGAPLRDMEGRLWWQYSIGYLAIEQLVERSSEVALFDFYRRLSPDTTWQAAFEESFGLTVDTFYEEFEEWREREVPPQVFYSGVVQDPAGNPMEDIFVTLSWKRSSGPFLVLAGEWAAAGPGVPDPDSFLIGHYGSRISVTGVNGAFELPAYPTSEAAIILWTPECGDVGILADDGSVTQAVSRARFFEIGVSEGVSDLVVTMPSSRDELCTPETSLTFNAREELDWDWWWY